MNSRVRPRGQTTMNVRVLPWLSVQPSVADVVRDVRSGAVKQEDVWLSAYVAAPERVSEHGSVRVARGAPVSSRSAALDVTRIEGPRWTVAVHGRIQVPPTVVHVPCVRGVLPVAHATTMDLTAPAAGTRRWCLGGADGALRAGVWGPCEQPQSPFTAAVDLPGHGSDITSATFFPSGEVVLSTSLDMRARVFSAIDGTCPRVLEGHTRAVLCSAMLGRGREVLTGGADDSVRLWDVGRGASVRVLSVGGAVRQLQICDSGLLGGIGACVPCWDLRVGNDAAVKTWTMPASPLGGRERAVEALAVRGHGLLVGTSDGMCAHYDLRADAPLTSWCRNTAGVTDMVWEDGAAVVATADGLPYRMTLDTLDVEELAGWDTERVCALRHDGTHVVAAGAEAWAVYS